MYSLYWQGKERFSHTKATSFSKTPKFSGLINRALHRIPTTLMDGTAILNFNTVYWTTFDIL